LKALIVFFKEVPVYDKNQDDVRKNRSSRKALFEAFLELNDDKLEDLRKFLIIMAIHQTT
jgi:hypothetical protein